MLLKKDCSTVAFVVFCIFLNFIGKYAAVNLHLPLWLDSVGTVSASYILGGLCGSIVGITVNVIYAGFSPLSYIYSITSVAIAFTVSYSARKKWFHSFYGTMCASVIVIVFSVFFSVAMSCIFSDGMTNNVWGDGVINYLSEQKVPHFICIIAGQFYIDFLDKVISLLILYFARKIWHKRRKIAWKLRRIGVAK